MTENEKTAETENETETRTANENETETETATETENATEEETGIGTASTTKNKTASVSDSGGAVGKVPTAVVAGVPSSERGKTRPKKERKLRTPVNLDVIVTFKRKEVEWFKGLKKRVVAQRLNRI